MARCWQILQDVVINITLHRITYEWGMTQESTISELLLNYVLPAISCGKSEANNLINK